jgi:hypothetical protein
MSLLTEASLLVTPNAYKEGKLYSIIPSNGNGDFTVTRATTATRVNAAGLIELVPYNFFQYSEQFNNAAWLPFASTVTANSTTAPNGTLTADTLTGDGISSAHRIAPAPAASISVISGNTYTASCYVKKNTNDFFQIFFQAGQFTANAFANFDVNNGVLGTVGSAATATITNVGNGWYRCSITSTAISTATSGVNFGLVTSTTATRNETNTLSTSLFLWGAQLVEGSSALDYQMTETRLNIPRLNYSLGSCPNILLEPTRTNVILYSSDLSQSVWNKTNYSLSSTTPVQGINATRITKNAVDNGSFTGTGTRNVVNSIGTYTAGTKTLTYLIRKGNTDKVGFLINNVLVGALTAVSCAFDFNTQTFTNVSAGLTTSFESPSANVYRISLTIADIGVAINKAIWIAPINASNSTIDGGYLDFAFAQWETGAYATSYIPTTTASVTRNLDQILRSNVYTNGLITASGGTWFVDLRNNVPVIRDLSTSGIFLNTGVISTIGNGLLLRNPGSSLSRMGIFTVVAGGLSSSLHTIATNNAKVAFKWDGTTADVFVNGVKVVTATPFTPTAMENLISEGANRAIQINSMALFPTPLTDTQCIALTT